MKSIRALVVDDSFFMRTVLSDILASSDEILVIGTARDGQEAVEKAVALKPDIITMDLDMPRMDGLDAVQAIMDKRPVPIVVVSAYAQEGAEATLRALELGAVDFVLKPRVAENVQLAPDREELIAKVIASSMANAARFAAARAEQGLLDSMAYKKRVGRSDLLIAIGASAGGPRALVEIFKLLPPTLASPLVVIQHMPSGFTASLADRLNAIGNLQVRQAEEGDSLEAGVALVAPGGRHMEIFADGLSARVSLRDDNVPSGVKPSIDRFMGSAVDRYAGNILAVVLTGMGRDGTEGSKLVCRAGGRVLAQDESTSLVYGMPKSAKEAGCVDRQVPIHSMARAILREVELMNGK